MIDIEAAQGFVQLHARLLDRRRLEHLLDGAGAEAVAAAVAAYANPDGGFAGVIEPDVRTTTSQPIGVLTAFDVLHEIGAGAPRAALDWLAAIAGPDGGIPFSLPSVAGAPHAPWMAATEGSSLHMTCAVAAAALRLGASHPWVEASAAFCRERIAAAADALSAYETRYALDFLDAAGDDQALDAWRERLPAGGRLPVASGVEGETLSLVELALPRGRRARRLFDEDQVQAELDELERGQHDDGGWDFDWLRWSPVAAHEWRGRLTVDALVKLAANGRLDVALSSAG